MKYFPLIFILLFSCAQKKTETTNGNKINEQQANTEKITTISTSTFGGEMGYAQSLKVTADSMYFSLDIIVDPTKRKRETKVNTQYKLEDLLNVNQLNQFAKIKNGESRLPVDGTDTQIEIITTQHTYTVVNGEGNGIWQSVHMIFSKILNKEFNIE